MLFESLVGVSKTEIDRIVKTRIGQGIFRKKLIARACKCELCGLTDSRFLVASHIKPWRDCDNEEKLSMHNGLLLCPNHDWLFDKGFITFTSVGTLLISEKLDDETRLFLNVKPTMKAYFDEKQQVYIEWHRNNVYLKE